MGLTIVGGSVVIAGSKDAAVFRVFCISTWSMMTMAAIASTTGTACRTTHGSCRPCTANTPGQPLYYAVVWAFCQQDQTRSAWRATSRISTVPRLHDTDRAGERDASRHLLSLIPVYVY